MEESRIGVYVCHCGLNIAGAVDVKRVTAYSSSLPEVVIARDYVYICSDPGQEIIKKDIKDLGLTRVVVASCSPRMHEPTFRRVLEESGLNPYLFEMVNIREHCSWVHTHEPEKATEKAMDLIRMAVARAKHLEPLEIKEAAALKSVLVIGGGIAGIQAALDLAEQEFKVFLVEKEPTIGGHMAKLDKTFPTLDCSACILTPKMVDVARHPNIRLLTYSEVKEVKGSVGNLVVKVLKKPRYVDETKCTGCGICAQHCPVEVPNEFDERLGVRKAIYVSFPQAVPLKYTIDKENCLDCGLCEKVCGAKAVNREQQPEEIELNVGAIIVATGYHLFDPSEIPAYGYGRYSNVITNMQLERLICASGPTGGHLLRPSDGKIPRSIAFIQCVGSRDTRTGQLNCSNTCCMNSIKQAIQIKEKHPESEIYIFYNDIRASGRGFEELYRNARELWVTFVRGIPSDVVEDPETKNLIVYAVDTALGKLMKTEVDLVVLSVGIVPPKDLENLASILRVPTGSDGFLLEAHPKLRPVDTTTTGVFIAGTCQGAKDVHTTVSHAKAAASGAAALLSKGKIRIESTTAYVNEDYCSGCRICEAICEYGAIEMKKLPGEKLSAVVVEVACTGCGACGSSCPTGAITMRHFTTEQLLAQVRAAA